LLIYTLKSTNAYINPRPMSNEFDSIAIILAEPKNNCNPAVIISDNTIAIRI
jgi:hypothetical protein